MALPNGPSRELKCLTRIVEAMEAGGPLDQVLHRILEILPEGFNYPEVLEARLTYGTHKVQSAGFRPGPFELRVLSKRKERVAKYKG